MAVAPVVRYMLLCDDWRIDPDSRRSVDVFGLMTNINPLDNPPTYPMHRDMCVLVLLTDGYGSGEARITCVFEENAKLMFSIGPRQIAFGRDPLSTVIVPFRIRRCVFPTAGLYSVQFQYDGEVLQECPLRVR